MIRSFDFKFGDFGHEAGGFGEGDDDFLVVEDVVEVELAVFTVFEPFLGRLVSADVEVPGYFGDVGEVLGFVDVDFVVVIVDFDDFVCSVDGVLGDVVVYHGAFQEVDLSDFAA